MHWSVLRFQACDTIVIFAFYEDRNKECFFRHLGGCFDSHGSYRGGTSSGPEADASGRGERECGMYLR